MTITAQIQFTQGSHTDIPGNAVFGDLSSGPVVCTCVTTGAPDTFVWSLIDKPATSALALGQFSPSSSGSFPQPDARGGYLVELTASLGTDTVTVHLAFIVKELSGRWIPPFKATDPALTFAGSTRGWAVALEQWLHYLDGLAASNIVNDSPVSGAKLKDALTTVNTEIVAINSALTSLVTPIKFTFLNLTDNFAATNIGILPAGFYLVVMELFLHTTGTAGGITANLAWTDKAGFGHAVSTVQDRGSVGLVCSETYMLSISVDGVHNVTHAVTGITTKGALQYDLRYTFTPQQ